jgi:hypothetical protein
VNDSSSGAPAAQSRTEVVLFATIDLLVIGFAWFTLVAQLWNAANWHTDLLLLVWVVTLPAPLVGFARLRDARSRRRHRPWRWFSRLALAPGLRHIVLAVVVVVAVVAALLLATANTHRTWDVGWALALAATAVGVLVALVPAPDDTVDVVESAADSDSDPTGDISARTATVGAWVALAIGVVYALGTCFLVSPSSDDAYYANRTTYIAEHHVIPDRDVIFSHGHYPALYRPEIGTFETFAGTAAALVGVRGATMTYLLLGPLVAGLIPLALWRAIRAARLRLPVLGLVAASTFLVMSAGGITWFGEMVLRRPWQTKEIYAAALIPLMYVYAVEFGRTRRLRPASLLIASSIAAVGLTSTAAGVSPIVLLVIAICGFVVYGAWFLVPLVPAMLYPIACLGVYRLAGSSAAVSSTAAFYKVSFTVWQWFVGIGLVGFIAALAVTVGFAGVPSRFVRSVMAMGGLVFMMLMTPGALRTLGRLMGGGPTWRIMWVLPLPLAVAALPSMIERVLPIGRAYVARSVAVAVSVAGVVALIAVGTPIIHANSVTESFSPSWDIAPRDLVAARRLIALTPPGATVAGPEFVNRAVAIITTSRLALDPNSYYGSLIATRSPAQFRMPERRKLTNWLGGHLPLDELEAAQRLRQWPVRAVCLSTRLRQDAAAAAADAFRSVGYVRAGGSAECSFFVLR